VARWGPIETCGHDATDEAARIADAMAANAVE